MTTDAEKIEYYRARLERLASSKPFDVSSGPTCHESDKRMEYAADALKGPQSSAYHLFMAENGIIDSDTAKRIWNASNDAAAATIMDFPERKKIIQKLRED